MTPQIVFINRAQLCFSTDPLLIVTNGCLDPVNRIDSCLPGKQDIMELHLQQLVLFDFNIRLDRINKAGDPLLQLEEAIDWDVFRVTLESRSQ